MLLLINKFTFSKFLNLKIDIKKFKFSINLDGLQLTKKLYLQGFTIAFSLFYLKNNSFALI